MEEYNNDSNDQVFDLVEGGEKIDLFDVNIIVEDIEERNTSLSDIEGRMSNEGKPYDYSSNRGGIPWKRYLRDIQEFILSVDSKSDIVKLQQDLNDIKWLVGDKLEVDGVYGPLTKKKWGQYLSANLHQIDTDELTDEAWKHSEQVILNTDWIEEGDYKNPIRDRLQNTMIGVGK